MDHSNNTNNIIGTKLKQLLGERGLTATELSRIANVRTSFIYDVLSGKSKNPSIITLSNIANALAVPLSELSGNEKKGVSAAGTNKESQHYVSIAELSVGEGSNIKGAAADSPANSAPYMFRRSWIQGTLNANADHIRSLSVTGDSMEPTLHHGDTILVDTSNTTPSPPGIFVLYDGYGLVVKRVDMLPGNTPPLLSIKSDNPKYTTYERALDDARILGRVIWKASTL